MKCVVFTHYSIKYKHTGLHMTYMSEAGDGRSQ